MSSIRWSVVPVPGGGWRGEVELPTADGSSSVAFRRASSSPGEALSGCLAGAAESCGQFDLAAMLPAVLQTANELAQTIARRIQQGQRAPAPEVMGSLPAPLVALSDALYRRPGGLPYAQPVASVGFNPMSLVSSALQAVPGVISAFTGTPQQSAPQAQQWGAPAPQQWGPPQAPPGPWGQPYGPPQSPPGWPGGPAYGGGGYAQPKGGGWAPAPKGW